ncbi:MAG: ATP-binding cassette domain-containing protein [Nocardioides sp.]|uniref:ABC transporter ATP-binding protein n=1 Tax=Nocardioides sp. TaxID=35761 RepID=UPI0039E3E9F7
MSGATTVREPKQSDHLVRFEDVQQHFAARGGAVRALDGVTFSVHRGEAIGLVGESGCGKSTLARAALMMERPTGGHVLVSGRDAAGLTPRARRAARQRMQMVFQDPNGSLDPRYSVIRSVMEPLVAAGVGRREARERAQDILERVGVDATAVNRRPHEFSGGQRQRIAIARALAADPEFVVLDEPTSALDVSIQAQILNLLLDLQRERDLTYLFISHNLAVIRHLATRVAVMYLGRIVEIGPTEDVFGNPLHPYTRALLSAVPDPTSDPGEQIVLKGDLPSPRQRHRGCAFASRCWLATDECRQDRPALQIHYDHRPDHEAACHRAGIG